MKSEQKSENKSFKFSNKTWIAKIEIYKEEEKFKNSIGPDNFKAVDLIGKGAFGQVLLVQHKDS